MVGPKGGVGLFDPATGKFDDRFASVETPSAFGAFCKGLDSADPNYWQRVYEHLGLKQRIMHFTNAKPYAGLLAVWLFS